MCKRCPESLNEVTNAQSSMRGGRHGGGDKLSVALSTRLVGDFREGFAQFAQSRRFV